MANAPDALGGIGYANIFQGSQAVDDWREDLKYNRFRKAKAAEDEAARRAKLKFDLEPIKGWTYDQIELTDGWNALAREAAAMIVKGEDPNLNAEHMGRRQQLIGLGNISDQNKTAFLEATEDLDNLYAKGDITPETYEAKLLELKDWATVGGKHGKAGGIYSRMQVPLPQNPATIPDMVGFIQKYQGVLEKKKQEKSYPTASGMQHTEKYVPQDDIDFTIDVLEQDPMYQRFTPDQQEQVKKGILVGGVNTDKPLPESQRGDSGSGYISGYKTVAIPTNAESKAQLKVIQQPTSFWQKALSAIGLGSIPANETELKPDIVAPVKLIFKGTEDKEPQPISYKTNDIEGNNIDKFRPYEVRETSKGYLVSGRAVYTENGVNKEMDTAILVTPEQKTDFEAIFMERDDGTIETIEEAIARSGVKKTTKSTTKKPQDDPLGIF